ncbi:hypothetical protein [Paenibacillus sp. FJAT-27812]|uniref:hypothetical protein n=1 Tax=Paenibacillus sp. FJAT-27812 TaxID=1684143 RepID=UPI0006A79188|nr:hypothetical protein [Paenibacillus sp. FJAT-27812]
MVRPCIEEINRIVREDQPDDVTAYINGLQAYFKDQQLGMSEVVYLWNQAVGLLINAYAEELKDMEMEFLNYSEIKERFEHFESLCSFLHDVLASIAVNYSRKIWAKPSPNTCRISE